MKRVTPDENDEAALSEYQAKMPGGGIWQSGASQCPPTL